VGVVAVLAACASAAEDASNGRVEPEDSATTATVDLLDPCAKPNLTTVEPGALTFAVPAAPAPPYFLTDQPADQEGLESAFAYALAEELRFRDPEVTWELVPAEDVLTGAFVDFDIALGGFVARPEEFPVIDYSAPYLQTETILDVTDDAARRALLALGGQDVADPATLRFAAPVQGNGRPWLIGKGWIPEGGGLALWARGGLEMEQARASTDVRVIDEPTRQWLSEVRGVEVADVFGVDTPDVEYSLALVAGNPLTSCVDRALSEMSEKGELQELAATWLDPSAWLEREGLE
jgi:polar amino acid transport system substrate-binding protein